MGWGWGVSGVLTNPLNPLWIRHCTYRRLKRQEKNASENVVCCKLLPSITDALNIEANRVDPELTAPIGAV